MENWTYSSTGNLDIIYRAKDWSTNPPTFMNAVQLTAVVASARTRLGAVIPVAQQPVYSASDEGYVGYLNAEDLVNVDFLIVKFVPTVAGGVPDGWAQPRYVEIVIYIPGEAGAYLDAA